VMPHFIPQNRTIDNCQTGSGHQWNIISTYRLGPSINGLSIRSSEHKSQEEHTPF
jgi:hypothetical protein